MKKRMIFWTCIIAILLISARPTEAQPWVRECHIDDSCIYTDNMDISELYPHGCYCNGSSDVNMAHMMNVEIFSSAITNPGDTTYGLDSFINNSVIPGGSNISFSTIENTDFTSYSPPCTSLEIYGAYMKDGMLISGRVRHKGQTYFGPYQIGQICAEAPPVSVGQLVIEPDVFNNNTFLLKRYYGADIGYDVTGTIQWSGSRTEPLQFNDEGTGYDQAAHDAVYTQGSSGLGSPDEWKTVNVLADTGFGSGLNIQKQIYLDNIKPNASIEVPSALVYLGISYSNTEFVNLELDFSDNLDTIFPDRTDEKRCRYGHNATELEGWAWEPCESQRVWYLGPDDGAKEIHYQVRDIANNTNITIYDIILDSGPPEINITSPGATEIVFGVINITYELSWDALSNSAEIRIGEGAEWKPANNIPQSRHEWNTTEWPDMTLQVTMRVKDAAGNYGYDSVEVLIDNTPPGVLIVQPGDHSYIEDEVLIKMIAHDAAWINLTINTTHMASIELYTSGDIWEYIHYTTSLEDGSYEITAKAYRFLPGNYPWYCLYQPIWPCKLGEDSVIVIKDTTDPTGSLNVDGPILSHTESIAVSEASPDTQMAVFEYRQGLGNWLPIETDYAAPFQVMWDTTEAPDGNFYTLRALLYDSAGNMGESNATDLAIDNTPPQITLTNPVPGTLIAGQISAEYSATDNIAGVDWDTWEWNIDSTGWIPIPNETNPWDTRNYGDGWHTLQLRVNDTEDNQAYSEIFGFTVDNTPEAITIIYPLSGIVMNDNITVTVIGPGNTNNVSLNITGLQNVTWWLHEPNWEFFWDISGFPDGDYTIQADGFDELGGYIGNDTEHPVTIDRTDPSFSNVSLEPIHLLGSPLLCTITGTVSVNVNGTASDTESILFEYTQDQLEYSTLGYTTKEANNWSLNLDTKTVYDGLMQVRATAKDAMGNTYSDHSIPCYVDNTPPEINITYPFPDQYLSRLVNITYNATDAGPGDVARVQLSIDGDTFFNIGAYHVWNTTLANDGAHTLQVRAYDHLGNLGYSRQILVRTDNSFPLGELIVEPYYVMDGTRMNMTYRGNGLDYSVLVNVSDADAPESGPAPIVLLTDPDRNSVYKGNHTISLNNTQPDGIKTLTANVSDTMGNYILSTAEVMLDNTRPNGWITISNLGVPGFESTNPNVTATRSVILEMDFEDVENNSVMSGVRDCRVSNSRITREYSIHLGHDNLTGENVSMIGDTLRLNNGYISGNFTSSTIIIPEGVASVKLSADQYIPGALGIETRFADGGTAETLRFHRSGKLTGYIRLPKEIVIDRAEVNITGANNNNGEYKIWVQTGDTQNGTVNADDWDAVAERIYITSDTEINGVSLYLEDGPNEGGQGTISIRDVNMKIIEISDYYCSKSNWCEIEFPKSIALAKGKFYHIVNNATPDKDTGLKQPPRIVNDNNTNTRLFYINGSDQIENATHDMAFRLYQTRTPTNPHIEMGYEYDKRIIWTKTGPYEGSEREDISYNLQRYLRDCAFDPCDIPLFAYSETAGDIIFEDLEVEYTEPAGKIDYHVSNNDGADWKPIVPGQTLIFDTMGTDLRFRGDISRSDASVASPNSTNIILHSSTSSWEQCTNTKLWQLSEGGGEKTVFLYVRDRAGNVRETSDTIWYNFSGAGLDPTPPTPPVVVDDGDYTNNATMLHAYWYNSTDRESELLHIPLVYMFRVWDVTEGLNITNWVYVGQSTEVTVVNSSASPFELDHGHNYTFHVKSVNSASLETLGKSDGIILDIVNPYVNVSSTTHPDQSEWYEDATVTINWTGQDELSGIYGYSYTLDGYNDTIPDNIHEGQQGEYDKKRNATYTLRNGIWYFHIKTQDKAGNWGGTAHFRVNIDIYKGPPAVTIITPRGLVVDENPEFWVTTNEPAICEFRQIEPDEENLTPFSITGNRDHRDKLFLEQGSYEYQVNCTDYVGMYNDTEKTNFTIMPDASPTDITVFCPDSEGDYYTGQSLEIMINVTAFYNGENVGLGGLKSFNVAINGQAVPVKVTDLGLGLYMLRFSMPEEEGELEITVSYPGTETVNYDPSENEHCGISELQVLKLNIGYSSIIQGTPLPPCTEEPCGQIAVLKYSGYQVGLASETQDAAGKPEGKNIRIETDGLDNSFILMSNPNSNIIKRASYLMDKSFMDLPYPSFGLPLDQNICPMTTLLKYEDIVLQSDDLKLYTGRFDLIFQKKGKIDGKNLVYVKLKTSGSEEAQKIIKYE
ncbi:hypothetical protein JW968_06025 [Candidatus Woesearchaeota archaeon]|nr:hypothetical protein [Candidatus Woesearchaeota archaeon]